MSWKFVFNSTVGDVWWGHMSEVIKAARGCGYQFFTWNGWVYSIDPVDSISDCTRTEIAVKDLV